MPVCDECGIRNSLANGGITYWPDFRKHLCEGCTEEYEDKPHDPSRQFNKRGIMI